MTPPSPALVDGLREKYAGEFAIDQMTVETALAAYFRTDGTPSHWMRAALKAALPALLDTLARLAGERESDQRYAADAAARVLRAELAERKAIGRAESVEAELARVRAENANIVELYHALENECWRLEALAANPQGATDERA